MLDFCLIVTFALYICMIFLYPIISMPDVRQTGVLFVVRNELVRAMDVRMAAIQKELSSSIARAAGDSCSIRQITDLAEFCRHFWAMSLRCVVQRKLIFS